MLKEILEFDEGLTVKELKKIIKDWPETREDGTHTEVWLGDASGISKPAVEVSTLNVDENEVSDIIISHCW